MRRGVEGSGSDTGGSARERAAGTVEELLATREPASERLEIGARRLSEADRRLYFELVLGTLRWLRMVDHVLAEAAGRPLEAFEGILLAPLRIAAYQLLYLDRVPPYAAVDEAVEEAKRRGRARAAGFANAVLRRIAARRTPGAWPLPGDDEARRLAIASSHPEFLVRRYFERFGASRAAEILAANNCRRPLHLLCCAPRAAIAAELAAEGIETRPARLSPLGLTVVAGDALGSDALARGRVYVQDDASQAAALVPAPRTGERVLDAAAAPGGKTLALLAAEATVWAVAADRSLPRLDRLAANLRRVRRSLPVVASDLRAAGVRPNFDRVVVDLPCSGTGTLSRHPELKWRLSAAEIERLAAGGLELLEHAAPLVRRGGLLCVVTCSIEEEENEEVVAALTERRRDLELVPLSGRVAPALEAGVVAAGLWRVLPSPDHDGFTVHVLRRSA